MRGGWCGAGGGARAGRGGGPGARPGGEWAGGVGRVGKTAGGGGRCGVVRGWGGGGEGGRGGEGWVGCVGGVPISPPKTPPPPPPPAPPQASYVRSLDGWKVPVSAEGLPKAFAPGYKTKDFVLPVVEVNQTKVEQYAAEYSELKFKLVQGECLA